MAKLHRVARLRYRGHKNFTEDPSIQRAAEMSRTARTLHEQQATETSLPFQPPPPPYPPPPDVTKTVAECLTTPFYGSAQVQIPPGWVLPPDHYGFSNVEVESRM